MQPFDAPAAAESLSTLHTQPPPSPSPPSLLSEPGTYRPYQRRGGRGGRKTRSVSSATELGDYPGSVTHMQPMGMPQLTNHYGVSYAFHLVENQSLVNNDVTATSSATAVGGAHPAVSVPSTATTHTTSDSLPTQQYYSFAPVLIHGTPAMLPYFTWDWRGYTAASGPQHHYYNSKRPPRQNNHNSKRTQNYHNHNNSDGIQPQRQQQLAQNKNNNNNSINGSSNKQQQQQQQQQRSYTANTATQAINGLGADQSSHHQMRSSKSAVSLASSDGSSYRNMPADVFQSPNNNNNNSRRSKRYQHQRKFSTASVESLQAVMDTGDDAPDLERFLKASTPCVQQVGGAAGVAELRLSDVWKFYEQPSVFGLECAALGGPRGPSTCYFVPYLSAVNLFMPTTGDEDGDDVEIFSFPQGLDSWPSQMKKEFSWAAAEHVADRLPLHTRITELATRDGTPLESHPLWSTRLVDLHPYSWFAVAWYPLYRIPDAPLTTRFLTFHSLAPLWEAATAAKREVKEAAEAAAAADRSCSASYKIMLESGGVLHGGVGNNANNNLALNTAGGNLFSDTPTAVLAGSYPNFPFSNSDGLTRSTGPNSAITATTYGGNSSLNGGAESRSHSVISAPATASDSLGSLTPSPACSDAGDERPGAPSSLNGTATMSTTGSTRCSALTAPAVGLCWHTAGSAAGENWTDTLVAVDVPEDAFGRGLRLGDVLPGPANASVAGVWPRTAVIRKDYPLAKGGPLSWEIQLEELEEGARRLALRQGLVKVVRPSLAANNGADGGENNALREEEEEPESCCPDHDFFSSRRR